MGILRYTLLEPDEIYLYLDTCRRRQANQRNNSSQMETLRRLLRRAISLYYISSVGTQSEICRYMEYGLHAIHVLYFLQQVYQVTDFLNTVIHFCNFLFTTPSKQQGNNFSNPSGNFHAFNKYKNLIFRGNV